VELRPLRFIRNLGRMRQIVSVLLNHGFGDLVERLHLGRYLRWSRRVLFKRRGPQEPLSRAQRCRLALEELGPTFIKFGQVISTRPDLVPDDVLTELKQLRENVPPFSSDIAIARVESSLGLPVTNAFAEFTTEPLAAGSLAQVHRAKHRDGQELAVKILRPGIAAEIERDISLMHELAVLIERYIPEAQIFDPIGLVGHFARTIRRELNLTREARTLEEFHRLFRNDATLTVPAVFRELSSDTVLTMDFIGGQRIDAPEKLTALGIDCAALAANGARIFLKQAFELGIFHGDPHPGNIRVLENGALCLLDYGMVGQLDESTRDSLIDLLVAIVRRDSASAVQVVEKIGQPFAEFDRPLLRAEIRDFIDTYYGVELSRLAIGHLLGDFVTILVSHGIRCPGDLMLLIRALVTLEGVGHTLDPKFNLAEVLQPFVQSAVRQRYSPSRIAGDIIHDVKALASAAHKVPVSLSRTLEKLANDDLRVQVEHRHIEKLITEVDRSSNRVVIGLILAALIVASALVLRTELHSWWLSVPMYLLSSLLGAWLVYGIFRSGRL
jgi:ubiquinone biosynthesis protein